MIKLSHVNRIELSDVTSNIFEKYKEHLLGDYVYGLRSAEGVGAIPPWTLSWAMTTLSESQRTSSLARRDTSWVRR